MKIIFLKTEECFLTEDIEKFSEKSGDEGEIAVGQWFIHTIGLESIATVKPMLPSSYVFIF